MKNPRIKLATEKRVKLIICSSIFITIVITLIVFIILVIHNRKKKPEISTSFSVSKSLGLDKESIKKFKVKYGGNLILIGQPINYFKRINSLKLAMFGFMKIYFINLKALKLKFEKFTKISNYIERYFINYQGPDIIPHYIETIIATNHLIKRFEIDTCKLPLSKKEEESIIKLDAKNITILQNNYYWESYIQHVAYNLRNYIQEKLILTLFTTWSNMIYHFATKSFDYMNHNQDVKDKWENNEENKIDLLIIANYPNIAEGMAWSLIYLILKDDYTKRKIFVGNEDNEKFLKKFRKEKQDYENFEYIIGLVYKLFDIVDIEVDKYTAEEYKQYVEDNRNIVDGIFDILEVEMELFLKYIKSLF